MALQLILSKAYEDLQQVFIYVIGMLKHMFLPMTISIVFCVHLVCAALGIDFAVCKADCLLFFFLKYGALDLR